MTNPDDLNRSNGMHYFMFNQALLGCLWCVVLWVVDVVPDGRFGEVGNVCV